MAKISLLVDTDVFIDYFNPGRYSYLFDSRRFAIYYSVVSKKELLSRPGLREVERRAILYELSRCRMVQLTETITSRYSELRDRYPSLEKEDALIAAGALVKRLPLVTRNRKHFKIVEGLILLGTR
jgi:hypothetical protein